MLLLYNNKTAIIVIVIECYNNTRATHRFFWQRRHVIAHQEDMLI